MTTCSTDDLDKAIQLARDEDSVSKDGSDRPKKLSRLAQLLNDKHDAVNTGPISERSRIAEIVLDEAIPVAEEALGLIAEHSPDRPEYLRDLATYYVSRFEDKRKMSDLNRAVELMRKAIDIDHTDRIRDVSRLAEYLGRRSKASGYSDSLDNSEDDSSTTEDSDNFSDEDEDLETDTSPTSRAREPIDADADIDEAIQLAQDVLYTTPDKGPARAEYLNNLANHYAYRYKAKHTIKDLKRAIDLVRKAVKTTEGVRDQAKYLHRLAVHLECMFNETVTADTLHSASKGSQTSAKARAPLDYLDEAVKLAQVAVDLTPNEDLDRARYLEGLAGHLFSRSYGRRSMDDLDKAIAVAREALRVIPEGHYTRPRYLHKPSGYLIQRWEIIHRREVTNTTVDLEEAIRLGGEALKGTAMFPKPELDRYIEIQDDLSQLLISRFERTRRKAGLKAALLEYLDKATLDDEKERPQLAAPSDEPTGNKASGAGKEPTDHNQDDIEASPNKKTGQAGRPQHQVDASHNQEAAVVLDRKIKLALATVNNMQDDDPNRSSHLSTLADALASRYEVVKNVDDLDKSIEIMRETVGLAADNYQEKPKHLSSLANLLVQRYEATNPSVDSEMGTESSGSSGEETSDTEGLNHSLDTDGETMEPEHSDGAEEGSECSEETTNNTSDLDEAIQLMRDAVEMLPKEHPDLPRYLNCLASYLADRYKDTEGTDYDSDVQSHGTEDLAESGDERVSADEEDSADGEDGADEDEANDLDEAIQLWQEAIDASGIARHDRAEYVDNLIKHLIYRYDSMNDLEEAVRLLEDEVKNTGLDYSDRPAILKRIGDHLDSIWDATEDDGLNTKIRIRQDALNVTPEDLPDRAKFLDELASNFSSSIDLYHRSKVTNAAVDREEATGLAVEIVRMNTKRKGHYEDILSHYVLKKYRHGKSMDDLNFAIDLIGEVIRATSEHHPQRNTYLDQLASCLDARFKRKRISADLKIALRIQKAVVETKTDDPVEEAGYLNNLANHLEFTSRGITGKKSDMDEAFRVAQKAIDTMPEGHPRLVTMLKNLASKFDHRYYSMGKDPNDRKRATSLYAKALNVENGVVLDRISAGQDALRDHIEDKNWERARSVSEAIVKLFPRLSLTSLPRSLQQHTLSNLSHLSGNAASAVLQTSGTAAEAVEILEAGRGIIASFLIDSRADISRLKDSKPLLYSEYVEVRNQASLPFDQEEVSEPSDISAGVQKPNRNNVPMMISQRYKDIQRLEDLESAIRREVGLERFLLPPTSADLIELANRGPVVVFNATEIRSDALLITESEGITHLPLSKLKFEELLDNVAKLAGEQKLVVGLTSTKSKRQQELQQILKWLWDVAVRQVLKKLKLLTPVASKSLPHVWWVTNGYMGLMPIHAAGDSKKTTSDYVVSSYIPTTKALQYARERDLRYVLEPHTSMLITAMPRTVGLNPLATEKEVEVVTETVKSLSSIAVSTLIEPPKSAVLETLSECGIVHFACHGISDSEDPSNGSLFLGKSTNEAPERLTVRELAGVRHSVAQIAYLSACSSAESSSIDLANEVIHIASAFQLLGFPHVIGTLWEADNQCATEVAGAFYRNLIEQLKESGADVSHDVVSYALHHAMRKLRQKKPGNVIGWAPFIHIGA